METSTTKLPHVFALLTGVILLTSAATWLVPSGAYQRETRTIEGQERTLVRPGTYEPIPKNISLRGALLGEEVEGKSTPVGLHGFLTAIPRGLEASADIIFFIFVIGGVLGILQRTGTIAAVIQALLQRLGGSAPWLTGIVMLLVATGSSTLGMGEEFIPLVPVFLLLSKRLGYDRVYGLAMVLLALEAGFAAGTTNPFTVNVAQAIAELPLNSGLGFRIVFFVCIVSVTIVFVLRYGTRIREDPSDSVMAGDDFDVSDADIQEQAFSMRQGIIVAGSVVIFAGILIAVQYLGWWMSDMAGGFLLIGFFAAIVGRLPLNEATRAFVRGMEEMVVAALVVGFARGIQVVMVDGQILDTVIHGVATTLGGVPRLVSVQGMLFFQAGLNLLIPSGSGQAAVTMPLMAPLADVLGITRQTAVFAFQCGDGFANVIIPTSGILMAMLNLAKVPYERWIRFVLPIFVLWMGLAAAFLTAAVLIGYA